jgi:hypothetical protein
MTRSLNVVITAGEHTCRDSADGPWCPFVGISPLGQVGTCRLFAKRLPFVCEDGSPGTDADWFGRLPECKAAEVGK